MDQAYQIFFTVVIPTIISGFMLAILNRHLNRKDKLDEARASAAREENIIILENLQAVGHLSELVARVLIRQGITNGETEETKTALAYYAKARDKANEYLLRQNAAANH